MRIIAQHIPPKKRSMRVCLFLFISSCMLHACSLEDPAYGDYINANKELIFCDNVTAIYFTEGSVTKNNPIYNNIDYSAAFIYNMCPTIAPNCVALTDNTHICTATCTNVCYGECVSDYADINIIACNDIDGKTITCADGYANCDGNISNGCEYLLSSANALDCIYDNTSDVHELLCDEGWADCDGDYMNGCEYDLVTNRALACVNKTVTCLDDSAFSDCDGNYRTGCEYDIVSQHAVSCEHKRVECQHGYGDCNKLYVDGCEVDLNSSQTNCGACTLFTIDAEGNKVIQENHVCAQGQVCNGEGLCTENCAEGSVVCGTSCVNAISNHIDVPSGGCEPKTDSNGNPFTQVYCVSNYSNCDDNPENGCEYVLSTNNAISCEHQQVICRDYFGDCDGNYSNGCEYNFLPNHAIACTRQSEDDGSTKVILDCASDFADCNGDYTDGCEFQLSTHNATACTRTADETTGEVSVSLTCLANKADCDNNYENGCEYDLLISHASACTYNTAYCSQTDVDCDNQQEDIKKRGLITCTAPYANVDADYQNGCEIDGSWSLQYCGAQGSADSDDTLSENFKGKACPGGQVCFSGTCGYTCDKDNGYTLCTDKCLNFKTLHLSSCTACIEGYCDFDGNLENGCEVNYVMLDEQFGVKLIKLQPELVPVIEFLLKMYGISYDLPKGADACFVCPPGFSPKPDRSGCNICPPGNYSYAGSKCFPCQLGTYLKDNACESCPLGTYAATTASTACSKCAAGTYASTKNSVSCATCPANTYSVVGAAECTPCPEGSSATAGSASCTPCADGTISSIGGTCVECHAGTYANDKHTECHACPSGTYSSAGATECTPCPVGSISSTGATECTPCGEGQYEFLHISCLSSCPDDYTANTATHACE